MERSRQRGEYLKKGCKECKRRKIKCDEFVDPPEDATPHVNSQGRLLCWQCTRLGKECIYPKKGERVARVSRKVMMRQSESHIENDLDLVAIDQSRTLSVASSTQSSTGPGQPETPRAYDSTAAKSRGSTITNTMRVGFSEITDVPLMTPVMDVSSICSSHGAQEPQVPTAIVAALVHAPLKQVAKHDAAKLSLASQECLGTSHSVPPAAYGSQSMDLGQQVKHMHVQEDVPLLQSRQMAVGQNLSGPIFPPNPPETLSERRGSTSSFQEQFNSTSSLAFTQGDLTDLAKYLNNLVSGMSKDNSNGYDLGLLLSDSLQLHHHAPNQYRPRRWLSISIPRNAAWDSLTNSHPREELYLKQFYDKFANIILPFHLYDPMTQTQFNPARDILLGCAQVEPFLAAAIISQGARSCFSHSALAEYEEAHFFYLLKCLKLLGPALAEASTKDDLSLTFNIETVLLTVLLLASSNAANPKQNWRPHLRGAKDLLIKYSANRGSIRRSKVLVFCKYWFILFEILAGLGLDLGGTVKLERELDLLLNCEDQEELRILAEIGVLQPNGFNLLFGYHNECVPILKDLIKLLEKTRADPNYIRCETFEYLRLLAALHAHLQKVFVDRLGVLNIDHAQSANFINTTLLDYMPGTEGKIISWMDISHQAYVLAAIITILTVFLGFSAASPHVQQLTSQLIALLERATLASRHLKIKHLILMLQWPAHVAGLNCVQALHKAVVGDLLRFAAKMGAGSANHTLARLERFWMGEDAGQNELDDQVDLVNY